MQQLKHPWIMVCCTVSIASDVAQVSRFDDVTDPATANAAKLGRDGQIYGAGAGPEMGGAFCD